MVGTAVLGAALGTGTALLIAMTIVVYKYYNLKKRSKEWHSLDNMQLPLMLDKYNKSIYPLLRRTEKVLKKHPETVLRRNPHCPILDGRPSMSGISPASCWMTHKRLESWARAAKERALGNSYHHHPAIGKGDKNGKNDSNSSSSLEEFNVEKELLNQGPPSQASSTQDVASDVLKSTSEAGASAHVPPPTLQHQSKSYPAGQPLLCRTPSVSSQSSLDSTASKQGHRGSSPQIRTFAPDGKTTFHYHHEATHTSSYPLRNSSRSPSPLRAASLDIRCSSPGTAHGLADIRTPSPSQSSLTSLTGSGFCVENDRYVENVACVCSGGSTSSCNSPVPPSPRTGLGRCLSPLFIHRTVTVPDSSAAAPPASPLGAIQPDLYLKKDGPLFISVPKESPSLGRLHLRLSYDFDKSDLVVHLIEAHDLASSDQGGFSDPYVRLTLSPEVDSRKRQTNICRNDPNPLFDQHFKFPVSHEELQSKTLILQVFDYDRFSRNDVIGEVSMVMSEFDVANSVEIWGEITKNKKPREDMQEVLVSLKLQTFVKVYLIINGKRTKKKKTVVKKGTSNPIWNEALTFTLSANNIANAAVEISIFDQGTDIIVNNILIGICTIGPKETGPEKDHWIDMTQSPRKAIACWHTIR
ncbi:unnamed protein product [Phyllotreta striolata]|nr:unnamed protein product [Phyllotreta striolata]